MPSTESLQPITNPFTEATLRRLILVNGKGGTGKSTLTRALGKHLQSQNKKTLIVTIEDPLQPTGKFIATGDGLTLYNCDAFSCFEEFVGLKIPIAPLVKLFVHNRFVKFLSQAAPGIPGLVMLGKTTYETKNFDHVILDMPSTGHALAMFQATRNFATIFGSGMVSRDANDMLALIGDPEQTLNLILALPEEMPLQEALDFDHGWKNFFPENQSCFLVNRVFPVTFLKMKKEKTFPAVDLDPNEFFAKEEEAYLWQRGQREWDNLTLWTKQLRTFFVLKWHLQDTPQDTMANFLSKPDATWIANHYE